MTFSWSFFLFGIALMSALIWAKTQRLAFRAQTPEGYETTLPQAEITSALNGPMDAEGMIFDFRGRMTSRFTARMDAKWQGNKGVMDEFFSYSTGRDQARQWRITVSNDGTFIAEADDIIGVAKGVQSGATLRMKYRIRLPQEAGGHVLDVIDWMYLVENGSILNRSEFRQFGIKVAELFATFRPAPQRA